ncbi:MAG: glycosyltransferase family 2 protein [bacterium]
MKLIIQIPCLNEEKTLPVTIGALPKSLGGVDEIETLIVDDGSTDRTLDVARECGVDHIVRFTANRGLAAAFAAGLDACLKLGADIIVNTDADNQYCADDIEKLVGPIIEGKADMVIGVRPIEEIKHFSFFKKRLQRFGSWVVNMFAGTSVEDTTSGFRAYSREAAVKINIVSNYTYTLESIIQSYEKKIVIQTVDIRTNETLRESRLISSISKYISLSFSTILRTYAMYRPLKYFSVLSAIMFIPGMILGLRFLYYFATGHGTGLIQSLILAAVFLIAGVIMFVIALVSDLIAINRKLIEDVLVRVKNIEINMSDEQ